VELIDAINKDLRETAKLKSNKKLPITGAIVSHCKVAIKNDFIKNSETIRDAVMRVPDVNFG